MLVKEVAKTFDYLILLQTGTSVCELDPIHHQGLLPRVRPGVICCIRDQNYQGAKLCSISIVDHGLIPACELEP